MVGTSTFDPVVRTERLELVPWTIPLIDAFIAGDRAAAERSLGIVFPEPFTPPPETADVLEFFRAVVEGDESGGAFLPRMIVRRDDRMAVGSIGCMSPDDSGASFFGYGIYPEFEGSGYASEAAVGLVDWCLQQPGVEIVRATIPVGHVASEIVSARAGLSNSCRQEIDGEITLNVWERSRA
jgi:ribosomal-protein-alanine N-acetyltransferase